MCVLFIVFDEVVDVVVGFLRLPFQKKFGVVQGGVVEELHDDVGSRAFLEDD
jgi:hypothetical protein